jgi:hypothetical protein
LAWFFPSVTCGLFIQEDGRAISAAARKLSPGGQVAMHKTTYLAVLFAVLVSACSGEYPVFEDRSDQVRLPHRIPSK